MAFLRAQGRSRTKPLRLDAPTSGSRLPPVELAVIGAEQAGTTALVRHLAAHPGFRLHRAEQMTYFTCGIEHDDGYMRAFRRYYGGADGAVLLAHCDAMLDCPAALDRLAEHNPAVQLVVMLRHPVERAWAAFWAARRARREAIPCFEAAIAAEQTGRDRTRHYLGGGKYSRHLARVYRRFRACQVHVILTAEWYQDAERIGADLAALFGLPAATADVTKRERPATWRSMVQRARACLVDHGVGETPVPPLSAATRRRLLAFYDPFTSELEQMLRRDLSSWRR